MRPEDTTAFAASSNEMRPILAHVHIDHKQEVAADGYRLHLAPSRKSVCPVCKKEGYTFPDWQQIIPRQFDYLAEADARELRGAFVRAGVFAREGSNLAEIRANGHLEIIGSSEVTGEGRNIVQCESVGNDMVIGINWKYAIDALDHCAPEGGKVTICILNPNAPILIENGSRKAVVMPMHIGWKDKMSKIKVGDKFALPHGIYTYHLERLEDDPNPMFDCERIRIKVTYPKILGQEPTIFGAEPNWFTQRGLEAETKG
jgi:hypothetical protein